MKFWCCLLWYALVFFGWFVCLMHNNLSEIKFTFNFCVCFYIQSFRLNILGWTKVACLCVCVCVCVCVSVLAL